MITTTACPHCVSETRRAVEAGTAKPGFTWFEVDGISHVAPAIWFVGRRQALEAAGATPTAAVLDACREWALHCAELEARS